MDLQFGGYVFAVGHNRMDRDEQFVCYLFIRQPFDHFNNDVFFAIAQFFRNVLVLVCVEEFDDFVADLFCRVVDGYRVVVMFQGMAVCQ